MSQSDDRRFSASPGPPRRASRRDTKTLLPLQTSSSFLLLAVVWLSRSGRRTLLPRVFWRAPKILAETLQTARRNLQQTFTILCASRILVWFRGRSHSISGELHVQSPDSSVSRNAMRCIFSARNLLLEVAEPRAGNVSKAHHRIH